ncbi:malvidin galactosylase UGT88C3-like [Tasmannia lanceolata]|uniref:malvidin galactosylase UGT88C3-like n=1 Tax=Tasmannia lanceolata TaxID=3420 RepID=UPI004062F712
MTVTLAFLPASEIGHLVSMVELAKHLVQQNPFSITFLLIRPPFQSSASSTTTSYIESVASSGLDIHFVHLPHVEPTSNPSPEAFYFNYINSHKPHVKHALTQLLSSSPSTPIAALIMDGFCLTMTDVASDLGIPPYLYYTSGALTLALTLYLPTLDTKISCDFQDFEGQVEIPGFQPLPPLVVPSPVLNKKSDGYTCLVSLAPKMGLTKGIIINTFTELESTVLEAINEGLCLPDNPTPPIHPVGPLLALDREPSENSNPCIEWLNKQPPASVVFLCFGSRGAFPEPQVKEIAFGLERSECRFLWSLRFHSGEGVGNGMPTDANVDEILPEGFLDRTEERGLVWPSWVPQTAILAHPAVGGFLSHCGWNSCLESFWYGVPILAWPLAAEQRLNGFQLVKDLGLAVELRLDYKGGGLVSGEEVERGVRCLMGECEERSKVRERAKEISEASRKAVEEGGSSFVHLKRLIDQLNK